MDLMNTELLSFTRDLPLNPEAGFKQDPKLAAAIDKLCSSQRKLIGSTQITMLPERKLEFSEVQELFKQSSINKVPIKPSHIMLKETNDARKLVIKKVEDILGDVNKSAENEDTPKLVIRNQKLWSNCIYDLDRVTLKSFKEAKKTILCYSNSEDKTRFNTIVFVLTKVHELLSKNMTVTRSAVWGMNPKRLEVARLNSMCSHMKNNLSV